MAAGTLKMTLITAFKFNMMNTTANRLEKKLYAQRVSNRIPHK